MHLYRYETITITKKKKDVMDLRMRHGGSWREERKEGK
jgi:hypothetical protein